MYTLKKTKAKICTSELIQKYTDTERFLDCCRQCPNFGQRWSCPQYDFSPEALWRQYDELLIFGTQIYFDKELAEKKYSAAEIEKLSGASLKAERRRLDAEMLAAEKEKDGSLALFAGSCIICDDCGRPSGEACRFPDKMRYSIESLGGNVAQLAEELLGVPLKWSKNGELPEYLTLVCGLLIKREC